MVVGGLCTGDKCAQKRRFCCGSHTASFTICFNLKCLVACSKPKHSCLNVDCTSVCVCVCVVLAATVCVCVCGRAFVPLLALRCCCCCCFCCCCALKKITTENVSSLRWSAKRLAPHLSNVNGNGNASQLLAPERRNAKRKLRNSVCGLFVVLLVRGINVFAESVTLVKTDKRARTGYMHSQPHKVSVSLSLCVCVRQTQRRCLVA